MIFNERDHAKLATLFDGRQDPLGSMLWPGPPYAGYKPEVREAPNSDMRECAQCSPVFTAEPPPCAICHGTGRVPNVDAGPAGKRYLHVALKYDPPAWAIEYLARAHFEACRVAEALGVPDAYYPRVENGTLRVLEYPSAGHVWRKTGSVYFCPHCDALRVTDVSTDASVCPALAPGAGSAEHTDFDLFTIVLWRSTPEDLERRPLDCEGVHSGGACASVRAAEAISPGLHIGRLGELVGLGPATPHRVPARPYVQRSIIYFAMPAMAARLPCPHTHRAHAGGLCTDGPTVREWLDEVYAASRIGPDGKPGAGYA